MQSKSPLVSIILPVYNGESTLRDTILSLLSQTFTDFELLIGIDGTNDNSKSIALSFNDSRIKIIENEINIGLGPNLNKLVKMVDPKSKFIAMAEQDDYYVLERLDLQLEVFNDNPEVGLVSGIAEFISDDNSLLFPGLLVRGEQFKQGKELFRYLYIYQLKVVNTCMMFRKSVHNHHQLIFNETYPNMNIDWDYILRFSLKSKIYGIPRVLVKMNRKKSNRSVSSNKNLQHQVSRQLLKDFRLEFSEIISKKDYNKALKEHRKIELGHHSRMGILYRAIYYYILYLDKYFINYLTKKIKLYFGEKN